MAEINPVVSDAVFTYHGTDGSDVRRMKEYTAADKAEIDSYVPPPPAEKRVDNAKSKACKCTPARAAGEVGVVVAAIVSGALLGEVGFQASTAAALAFGTGGLAVAALGFAGLYFVYDDSNW